MDLLVVKHYYMYYMSKYTIDMPKFSNNSIFLNFDILFYEMNSLQYKILKEIDSHIFSPHRFKLTYEFRPVN